MFSRIICFGALVAFALGASTLDVCAQTLTLNNDIHRVATLPSTTATLTGTSELHVTGTGDPLPGSIIHLNSPDAWLFLDSIIPSQVASSFLGRVQVSGAAAVLNTNVRVVQYGLGTVVIPHAPSFTPLQVFDGSAFSGASSQLSQYTAYNAASLGSFSNAISSFKLKRGYMATVAQNENGTGISKTYVAQDGDLEVGILPAPLNDSIKFVRVFPWRWVNKKGIAGNIGSNLDIQWWYNWNLDQNSSLDMEYVAIRQTRWWPGLGQDWNARGVNHLLGYNEPDSASQSNIAVGDAVWSWPDLLGTGLRVGAPAVTDGGLSWLYSFIEQCDAAGLRVDYIPVHYYRCYGNAADPNGAATQFYNFLKGIYDRTKRPIWVTEWNNGANWTSCADPTYEQQEATVAAMTDMLDNAPFVERYALYNWVEDVRRVEWDDSSLTLAGEVYRDNVSPLSYTQEIPDPETTANASFTFEGNALDVSGNGHNGMQVGARLFAAGKNGQALSFDGANDFIRLSPRLGSSTNFTFAAWIYWAGGANWQRILDIGDGTNKYLFLSPKSGSNTLRFAIKNGGSEQQLNGTTLPINTWTHVAVTIAGNTGKLFVNGALVATNTAMTINPADLSAKLNYLGKSQFSADPLFAGRIDNAHFFGRALTDTEVSALANGTSPTPPATTLPNPWVMEDVGAIGATGSASYSGGTFTINASGADIVGAADEFSYAYQIGEGDCSAVGRVASVQNTNASAKAGVMIRESTAADSAFAAVFITPGSGVTFQRRTTTAGTTASTVVTGVTAPRWVRLVRTTSTFAAYYSADGTTWTQIGTGISIPMQRSVKLGLAVTSHLDGTLCTATINNVTATP